MSFSKRPNRTNAVTDSWPARKVCFLLCMICSSAFAQQPTVSLRYLLFDPVPIRVTPIEGDNSYTVTELSRLPDGEAVDLRSWLAQLTPAFTQLDQDTIERQLDYFNDTIESVELSDGAFSPRLGQELQAQGNALLQAGDINGALVAFDRAAHIIRVNNGLFSLDQAPVIEDTIEAHLSRGDLISANEQQEYLYYLQQKSFGNTDPDQYLQALHSFAEWNLYAFNSNYYEISRIANAASSEAINSLSFQAFRAQSLLKAQMLYMQIVDILTRGFGKSDPRLPEAEKALAVTSYLYLTNFDLAEDFASEQRPYDISMMPKNALGSRIGKDALERRIVYLQNRPDTDPQTLTEARLDLADWLLFSRKRTNSLEAMLLAYEGAVSSGLSGQALQALFAPPLPAVVPSFAHPRFSRAALKVPQDLALDYHGYIDVDYFLNKYGQIRTAQVLGSSPGTPVEITERLMRNLRNAQFRPRIQEGALLESDHITARFYYTY